MSNFEMECEEKLKTLRNWNKVEFTPEASLIFRQKKNRITIDKTEIDIDEVVEALKMYYIELIKVEQRRK
ncbi:hypothetical protein VSU16_03295 [Cetobacterium somerae]|uniref:hypothetical protein n=1 Tax=Cetobacterium somerae TaxID=188913 RepID=UPI002E7C5458|nr:hypothetical protein [Cetobacterium somerae]WVJ01766.1 hypothetical protein VSU16_03295 [Cetobacterium somerae]